MPDIRASWACFPLFEVRPDGSCACGNSGCKLAGKHPEYPFSQLGKGEQVRGVEGRGYGIATGERSGIFVVDFDTIEAYEKMADRLPETHAVATGRGVHLYFKHPGFPVKNSVSGLAPDVDVRGEGGFVVAAGSKHKSGKVYETLDDREPVDAPAWLIEWPGLRDSAKARTTASDRAPIPCDGDELTRRTEMARKYLEAAPASIEGQNGSAALWTVALHLVRRLELPPDTAAELIEQHYNPRCEPEWSEEEIWHKLEDARDKSDMPTGIAPEGFGESKTTKLLNSLAAKTDSPEDPIPEPASELSKLEFPQLVNLLHRHEAWRGVFRFDVLSRRAVAINPPIPMRMETGCLSVGDVGAIRMWLSNPPANGDAVAECGLNVSADMVKEAIRTLAERHRFNPFVDWLDSLPPPDQVVELDKVHETILKSPDGAICSSVFKKQLVAAVRRARAAGTKAKVDHQVVMVLVGAQDVGKTRFLRLLGGQWYAPLTGDIRNKDTILKLQGKVVVEMEELATKKQADRDALKAFLSTSDDFERKPYAEDAEQVARSYVIFGSANDPELTDPTGNRRFAMIQVDSVDIEYAGRVMETLWAEANYLASTGFDHHLTAEEKDETRSLAAQHEQIDPWVNSVRDYLAGKVWIRGCEDVFENCIARGVQDRLLKFDRTMQRRISDVLRHLGCKKSWPKPGDRSVKGWKVADDITNGTPGAEEQTARAASSLADKAKLLAKN